MKTFALALIAVAAAAGYLGWMRPPAPASPPITVAATPERAERGRRVWALAGCDRCHSERDFTRFGAPAAEKGRGAGSASAPNITPHPEAGIGRWSDDEIVRAVRDGVGRDGAPLDPRMPAATYRSMSDQDAASLVAYLRTLAPSPKVRPRQERGLAAAWLARIAPRMRAAGALPPDASDRVRHGAYLATVGGCAGCHTRDGAPALSGGREFKVGRARVTSANLTPDPYTGIGRWSEADFVERFQQYRAYLVHGAPEVGPQGVTVMPWLELCRLDDAELRSLFAYLRSLKPVRARQHAAGAVRRP